VQKHWNQSAMRLIYKHMQMPLEPEESKHD